MSERSEHRLGVGLSGSRWGLSGDRLAGRPGLLRGDFVSMKDGKMTKCKG